MDEALIEAMAAAAWNRHANVRWDEFFIGDRAASKTFYLQAMRAAAEVYRLHQSTAVRQDVRQRRALDD